MKQEINLDFIKRRRIPWIGLVLMALALAWTGSALREWIAMRSQLEQAQAKLVQLRAAIVAQDLKAKARQAAADPAIQAKTKEAAQVSLALTYGWNRMFATLEQASGDHVALLSFVHDQATKSAQVTVEARDVPTLIGVVDKLNEGDDAPVWHLAGYTFHPENSPPTVRATIEYRAPNLPE